MPNIKIKLKATSAYIKIQILLLNLFYIFKFARLQSNDLKNH